ncbi:hypothetical protein BOTCAL_0288g00030 [Botryotinia calthae]|uniref:Uncharacterized protein n=1 Tax=Botryotinia calthae TaxID=38488 RepID=A0A4Y8CUX8_9HELO|nr:hypothetical protein BOTCAL_0288g00030 [Botryotinia calthae]
MTESLELEDGFKKSCAAFDQDALELNKQIEATQEELQQHKEKNDGHIAELERIQERLVNIKKNLQETGAEHKDCCGLADSGREDGNGDRRKDGQVEKL